MYVAHTPTEGVNHGTYITRIHQPSKGGSPKDIEWDGLDSFIQDAVLKPHTLDTTFTLKLS